MTKGLIKQQPSNNSEVSFSHVSALAHLSSMALLNHSLQELHRNWGAWWGNSPTMCCWQMTRTGSSPCNCCSSTWAIARNTVSNYSDTRAACNSIRCSDLTMRVIGDSPSSCQRLARAGGCSPWCCWPAILDTAGDGGYSGLHLLLLPVPSGPHDIILHMGKN